MAEDRRIAQLQARQRRELASYLTEIVRPFSPYYGGRLTARSDPADPLGELAPISAVEVGNGETMVLSASDDRIRASSDRRLQAKVAMGVLFRRDAEVRRAEVEPQFRPLLWLRSGPLSVAYTAWDLDRLGELGRRSLEHAGLTDADRVLTLDAAGVDIAGWQLMLGARAAGIEVSVAAEGGSAAERGARRPTVLAGHPASLAVALEAARVNRRLAGVRLVLVLGGPLSGLDDLRAAATDLGVKMIRWWAPEGARAAWAGCDGSSALHTWLDSELVERQGRRGPTADGEKDGPLLWTALGWRGSVVLRYRTGLNGRLSVGACPSCSRPSVRVVPTTAVDTSIAPVAARIFDPDTGPGQTVIPAAPARPPRPRVVPRPPAANGRPTVATGPGPIDAVRAGRLLDRHPSVLAWQVEHRAGPDGRELIVFVALPPDAHPGPTLRELDTRLGATQYVVLSEPDVLARVREAGSLVGGR